MGFFNKYPYTDFHELNLDWCLQTIKLIQEKVDNFINFNSIKYADPIEWNITTQYQENTVVIDNVNHIAYLSTQPVPAGVLLTDADYWIPILDLRSFYAEIGDLTELDTTAKDTLVNAINEVLHDVETLSFAMPDPYVNLAAHSEDYSDGDIIVTNGFYTKGSGAGYYLIHDTSESYCIPFGTKWAELIVDTVINIDALGAVEKNVTPNNNSSILETAIVLANHIEAKTPLIADITRGNVVIQFGPHYYKFSSNIAHIVNNSALTFRGIDENSSVIEYLDTSDYLINIETHTDGLGNDSYFFENLTFVGAGNMIEANDINHSKFTNCRFISANIGVHLINPVAVNFEQCHFFGSADSGCKITGYLTTTCFNECSFRHCTIGLSVDTNNVGIGLHIENCIAEYCSAYGIKVEETKDVSITHSWIEANDVWFADCELYAYDNHVTNGPGAPMPFLIAQRTSGTIKSYIEGVNSVSLSTRNFTYNRGRVDYGNGDIFDFDKRTLSIRSVKSFNFDTIGDDLYGTIDIHSTEGNWFGVYSYSYNNSFTVTKLGGTLSDPNVTGNTLSVSNIITGDDFSITITL